MIICLDTHVLVQRFGARRPFAPIGDALIEGRLEWAISSSTFEN